MTKRCFSAVVALLLLLALPGAPAVSAQSETQVYYGFMGKEITDLDYDGTTISYGENSVVFQLGSKTAIVIGREVPMTLPAQLINDKTLVPLRFISEQLGFTVTYDQQNHIAEVTI